MKNRNAGIAFILHIPLIMSILSGSAFAEDPCRKNLTNAFYNEYARSDSRLRDRSLYAELCSLNLEQARAAIKRTRLSGDDGSVGLTYGLFTLEDIEPGSGANSGPGPSESALSEDRFRQWKSGYCSKNSKVESSQAAEFFMQKAVEGKTASMRSLENWSACMRKREGLTCWVAPVAAKNEEVLFNVNWKKNGSSQSQAQPELRYSFLTRGAVSEFEGTPAKRLLPSGYKLDAGTLQIPIARPADTGIFADLKVNHAGTEHSCKVFIPGDRDFTLSAPFVNRLKFRYPG